VVGNRIWKIKRRNDEVTQPVATDERHAAFLAIEEILGAPDTEIREVPRPAPTPIRPGLQLPLRVPAPAPARALAPAVRKARHFRLKKQFAIVALALALAVLIGTVVGSGFFNASDRMNSQLYESQQGEGESYGVRDVPGHPGAGY